MVVSYRLRFMEVMEVMEAIQEMGPIQTMEAIQDMEAMFIAQITKLNTGTVIVYMVTDMVMVHAIIEELR